MSSSSACSARCPEWARCPRCVYVQESTYSCPAPARAQSNALKGHDVLGVSTCTNQYIHVQLQHGLKAMPWALSWRVSLHESTINVQQELRATPRVGTMYREHTYARILTYSCPAPARAQSNVLSGHDVLAYPLARINY